MTAQRRLVVNADDYGLTSGVCTGILRAHQHGIVTSTSVLAPAPALCSHAAALRDSGIAAGLHLCLVGEDPPVLSAAEVPTLVDRHGNLATSWRSLSRRALLGRVDPDDVTREFRAQADLVQGLGVELSHLDSHQYVHLLPSIAPLTIALANELGVGSIRVPGSRRRTPVALVVERLADRFRIAAAQAGLRTPDQAVGLDEAGSMTHDSLRLAIDALGSAPGDADVTVHPGEAEDPDRARYEWGYSWPDELSALCSADATEWVRRAGFVLSDYR